VAFWNRAVDRLGDRHRPRLVRPDAFAIQVVVKSVGPLPEGHREQALQLLGDAAVHIREQLQSKSLPLGTDESDRRSGDPEPYARPADEPSDETPVPNAIDPAAGDIPGVLTPPDEGTSGEKGAPEGDGSGDADQ
jgi:hypothetical protein